MRVKGWSGRSGLAKVDLYTRGTVYLLVWAAVLGLVLLMLTRPVRTGIPVVAVVAPLLALAYGVVCTRLARHSMDAYLGRGGVPSRLVAWSAAMAVVMTGATLWLARAIALEGALPTALSAALVPFLTGHCLVVRIRTTVLIQAGVLAVLAALVPLTGRVTEQTVVALVSVGFATGWIAFTARASMWMLAVMWELREARDVQARLAVAEERLRFGRDLHDVLGRNLAVIALKTELAVQLSQRGAGEQALDQMTEVQRIARESQREVRDVVRGYREADLHTELEGARGVLSAAGINCAIASADHEPDLPAVVQSALAWVVREATTNVLRHGDAARCAIHLAASGGSAVLTVENDGVRETAQPGGPAAGTRGSGLAGLRERLAALDGSLDVGPAPGGRFRLTARVPLAPYGPGAVGPDGTPPHDAAPERPSLDDDPPGAGRNGSAPEQEDDRDPGPRTGAARR